MRDKVIIAVALLALLTIIMVSSPVTAQSATVSADDVGIGEPGEVGQTEIQIEADEGVASADVGLSIDDTNVEVVDAESDEENADVEGKTADSVEFSYTDIGASQTEINLGVVTFEMTEDVVDNVEIELEPTDFNTAEEESFEEVNVESGTLVLGGSQATVSADDASISQVENTASSDVGIEANDVIGAAEVTVSIETPSAVVSEAQGTEAQVIEQDENKVVFEYTDEGADQTQADIGTIVFEMVEDTVEQVPIEISHQNVNTVEEGETVPFDNVNTQEGTLSLEGQEDDLTATVSASDVFLDQAGEVGQTEVVVDSSTGLSSADVDVSIDDTNAEIVDVEEDEGDAEVVNTGHAEFEYTDIGAEDDGEDQTISLGTVTFEMTENVEDDVTIGLDTANFNSRDGTGSVPFDNVETEEGTLHLGSEGFTEPLIEGFENPPTNTQELDDELFEDLSGDGDGTDVSQTVQVFGELIRGTDLGLSPEQAELLNWNDDSPSDEVTVADMVALFGEQIRA